MMGYFIYFATQSETVTGLGTPPAKYKSPTSLFIKSLMYYTAVSARDSQANLRLSD